MEAWLGWSHPLPTHSYFLLAFSANLKEGKNSETQTPATPSAVTLLCQKVDLKPKTQIIIKKILFSMTAGFTPNINLSIFKQLLVLQSLPRIDHLSKTFEDVLLHSAEFPPVSPPRSCFWSSNIHHSNHRNHLPTEHSDNPTTRSILVPGSKGTHGCFRNWIAQSERKRLNLVPPKLGKGLYQNQFFIFNLFWQLWEYNSLFPWLLL